MSIDWAGVWEWLAPILKQGLVALLVSLLAILGYDQKVESRYVRHNLTPAERDSGPGPSPSKRGVKGRGK